MQRTKVLLPEPDGPTMHSTSPLRTSRSIPRRTSLAPKCLRTPSARTMTSAMLGRSYTGDIAGDHGRLGTERYFRGPHLEGPFKALPASRGQLAHGPPGVVPLEVVLPHHKYRCDDEIP